MIINPLTRQVLTNKWSDAARVASALVRRLGRSHNASKTLIRKAAKEAGAKNVRYLEGGRFGLIGKWKETAEGLIPSAKLKKPRIFVGKGMLDREVSMHELGHLKSGHLDILPKRITPEDHQAFEDQAWDWAIKNAKKYNISKRKLIRLKRA